LMLHGLFSYGPSKSAADTQTLLENLTSAPRIDSAESADIWLTSGAEKLMGGEPVERSQLLYLAEIAQVGAEEQPDNAYWGLVGAAMLDDLGSPNAARKSWAEASSKTSWVRLEEARLKDLQNAMDEEYSHPFAWHCGFVLSRRSGAPEVLAAAYGRKLCHTGDTAARIESAKAGQLILFGSGTIRGQVAGRLLIRAAIRGGRDITTEEEWLAARSELISAAPDEDLEPVLNLAGSLGEGLSDLAEQSLLFDRLLLLSAATAALPGTLIMAGLMGVLIWFLGQRLVDFGLETKSIPIAVGIGIGSVGGVAVYFVTSQLTASLFVLVCLTLPILGPEGGKTSPRRLSMGMTYTAWISGALGAIFAALFLIGLTGAGRAIWPSIGQTASRISDIRVLAAASMACLAFPIGLAGLWAGAARRSTAEVAAITLTSIGAAMGAAGICLSILIAPFAVTIDRQLCADLEMIAAHRSDSPEVQ
jgi:hypothetical protein